MWLDLILIVIVAYVAWRQARLEQKVEAMEKQINIMADMWDKEFDNDNEG